MRYAIRNSLILLALLFFVVLVVVVGNARYNSKLKKLQKSNKESNTQLANLKAANPDMQDQEMFAGNLENLERRVKNESKFISRENTPTSTYKYLLDICDRSCPDLKFNFKYTDSGMVETSMYNSYSIIGEAPLRSLYQFIHQIENQFMLYVIDSIMLTGIESADKPEDYVNFTIDLRAYYEETAIEMEDIPFRNLKYRTISNNPFIARIHGPIPVEYELNFVNINNSILIGLTVNKVFMQDNKSKIHVLNVGDKVAYGYLDRIEWNEQSAVFKLNEIGIVKEKVIVLSEYGKYKE